MADLEPNFWIDVEGDVVAQLVDHIVLLAFESQVLFAERFGGVAWEGDLTEPPTFTFHTDPPARFAPSFVGSTSADGSWMWGWHNINQFAEPVVAIANTVHGNGEQLGIAELTTALQPLDAEARAAQGLPVRTDVATQYVLLTQALSLDPAPVWFRSFGESADDQATFILRNDADFALPPARSLSVNRTLTEGLSSGMMTDHVLAVHSYAARREGIVLDRADADCYELRCADGTVIVRFDDLRRISAIESTVGPESVGPETVGAEWSDG
ncbi:DUF6882 domain-containing protein [Williamsia herbipolensis]|uniref:DUF6882 domain-containing protein n=1 Tax=Williamsia herbipolensis TaxID=1603258 RepID=UPI0005F7892B|nr:DUF6882 domain-containing protein [Williamsia herbipolensis]